MKKLRNFVIFSVTVLCVVMVLVGKSDEDDIATPEPTAVVQQETIVVDATSTEVPPTIMPTTEPTDIPTLTITVEPTVVEMPTSTYVPTPTSDVIVLGWLCDWDRRGEVALWSKPALAFQDGNEIVAVVPMSVGGCIRVEIVQERMENYIDFYEVSFDDNVPLGWVDVDYCYPDRFGGKPDWANE